MNVRKSNILLVAIFFIGLLLLLYPTISNYWNTKTQTRAIASYQEAVSKMSAEECARLFAEAEAYNVRLRALAQPLLYYDRIPGYDNLLDPDGTGIMAYVSIDKLKVELPIYHGTADAILNVAAGHLQGSSLPIGGVGTHAVITAHRGLPRAKLFTQLDKLEPMDRFRITVLDRVLTYEVYKVQIVEPHEVDSIKILTDKDRCTLQTCTPYGINTHRLLVHGKRVEGDDRSQLYVPPDAYRIDPLVVTPLVAAPMLLILLIGLLVRRRKR